MQGTILSPHLAPPLLNDVSQRWSQYINRCVAALASEVVEAPGASIPFSLEPIMVVLEEGRYVGPILPGPLADLLAGRRAAGGGGRGRGQGGVPSSDGSESKTSRVGASGGGA